MSVKKFTLRRLNYQTKSMDGLFKYNGTRTRFSPALNSSGHLESIHFGASA